MALIAVFTDAEEGHISCSLTLAKVLSDQGHRVVYLSFPSAKSAILAEGFDFVPVLEGVVPAEARSASAVRPTELFTSIVRSGAMDSVIGKLSPSVVITLTVLALEAIAVRYRYDIPVVLLRAQCNFKNRRDICRGYITSRLSLLHDGVTDLLDLLNSKKIVCRNFNDIADLALQMPEIVFFPYEIFEKPEPPDESVYYVGTGIDLQPAGQGLNHGFGCGSPIVYCSLGSQSYLRSEISTRFFNTVLDAFVELPDLRLILATGKGFKTGFEPKSANQYVTEWAPQLAVLKESALMITHGGSGTVKECIVSGVPMIVLPLMRDQFECARMVEQRGIGVQADIATISVDNLITLVRKVVGAVGYKEQIALLRGWFLRNNWSTAVQAIERLLLVDPSRIRSKSEK